MRRQLEDFRIDGLADGSLHYTLLNKLPIAHAPRLTTHRRAVELVIQRLVKSLRARLYLARLPGVIRSAGSRRIPADRCR